MRVALITGAGSGIGQVTAIRLAQAGYRVALVGRRAERLAETARSLPAGSSSLVLAADVSRAHACAEALRRLQETWGRLDVLINNAGEAPMGPIEAHTPDLIDRVFGVNALGPAYLIAGAWPLFRAQFEREGRGGCVINVATLGVVDPLPGFFAYAAAKAAAASMIRSVAREGVAIGVRGFAIAPGAVDTEMFHALPIAANVPRSRLLSPHAVADVILDCVQGQRDQSNGQVIVLAAPTSDEA